MAELERMMRRKLESFGQQSVADLLLDASPLRSADSFSEANRSAFLLQQAAQRRTLLPVACASAAALALRSSQAALNGAVAVARREDGDDATAQALVAPAARFGADLEVQNQHKLHTGAMRIDPQPTARAPGAALELIEDEYAEFLREASAWRKRHRKRLRNQSADSDAAKLEQAAAAARESPLDALRAKMDLCAAQSNQHLMRRCVRQLQRCLLQELQQQHHSASFARGAVAEAFARVFYTCLETGATVATAGPPLRALRALVPAECELMVPPCCLADTDLADEHVSMLCEAVRRQRHALADLLLREGGADPDLPLAGGCTCAAVAAFRDDANMLALLAQHGAQLDRRAVSGATPLCVAAVRGCANAARFLVGSGAVDLDAAAEDGTTPLLAAVQGGHTAVAAALLQCGADVNCCKANGSSPVVVAVRHDRAAALLPLLAAHGADPDLPLSNGATALVLACANSDLAAIEQLLRMGADTRRTLASGADALAYACHRGTRAAVVRLMSAPTAPVADLAQQNLPRLRHIVKTKGRDAVARWLDAWENNGGPQGLLRGGLELCAALGDAAGAAALFRNESFVPAERWARLAAVAEGDAAAVVERAARPFARDSADLWPLQFRLTARRVLDATRKGGDRDVVLCVLSFCGRDWFD